MLIANHIYTFSFVFLFQMYVFASQTDMGGLNLMKIDIFLKRLNEEKKEYKKRNDGKREF